MPLYQEKIKHHDGVPMKTSGTDGEIRLGLYQGHLRMYVKYKGSWHTINFDGVTESGNIVSTNVTLMETVVTNQIISNLTVDNIKVNNNIIDSGGVGVNASTIITHPSNTTQAHPDYLLNTGSDEMLGSLELRGGNTLGSTEDYILNCKTYTSSTPSFFVGNNEYQQNSQVVYDHRAGFWIAPGSITGRLEVGTASGDNFVVEDDGDVKGQKFIATGVLSSAGLDIDGYTTIDSSRNIDIGTSAITCGTINTGQGANEVYSLVTGSDASNGTITYESGSAQGTNAYKFKVTNNSISDTQLEYNTGQDLSPHTANASISVPNFTRIGIGQAAHATTPFAISSSEEIKILMTDSGYASGIGSKNNGDILLQPYSGSDVLIHSTETIASESYQSGFTGNGWSITTTGSKSQLDVDNLNVRGTMSVYELLINQIRATNGSVIIGSADKVIDATLVDASDNPEVQNEDFDQYNVNPGSNDSFTDWTVNSYSSAMVKADTFGSDNVLYINGDYSYRQIRQEIADVNWTAGNKYLVSVECYFQYPTPLSTVTFGQGLGLRVGGIVGDVTFHPLFPTDTRNLQLAQYGSDANAWKTQKQILQAVVTPTVISAQDLIVNITTGLYGDVAIGKVTVHPEYLCTIESDHDDGDANTGLNFVHFKEDDLVLAQKWGGTTGDPPYTPTVIVQGRVTEVGGQNGSTIENDTFKAHFSEGETHLGNDLPLDFVRIGNTSDADRQGVIYLTSEDSGSPFIDVVDGINSWSLWRNPISSKARYGKLTGVNDSDMGSLTGYGLYSDNVYLRGKIQATEGYIGNRNQGWEITATGLTNASSNTNTNISIGSGGHGAAAQKFYIDGAGDFSLGDKLVFTGSTGDLTIAGGSLTIQASDISDGETAFGTAGADLQSLSTLNADSIAGQTGLYMDSSKLGFVDSGTFKTYMDNTGKFVLTGSSTDGLDWNPSTNILAITGAITVTNTGDFADPNADETTATLENGVSITSGGITMSTGGSIKGGQTDYNTGDGFFLGYSGAAHKLSIGGDNGSLAFDGDELTVDGNIFARGGTFSGNISLTGSVNMIDGSDIMTIGTDVNGTNDGIHMNTTNKWYSTGEFAVGDQDSRITFDPSAQGALEITIGQGGEFKLGNTDISNNNNIASWINLNSGGVQIGGEHISITGQTTFESGLNPQENWAPVFNWMGVGNNGANITSNMNGTLSYPGIQGGAIYSTIAYIDGSINDSVVLLGNNDNNDEIWIDGSGASGNAVSTTDEWKSARIPFNPKVLYKISIRLKAPEGTGSIYCGVSGFNANNDGYINANGSASFSSQHYFAMSGVTNASIGDNWVIYEGYFKGHSNTAGGQHNSAGDPGNMRTGVAYFTPLFLANYNNQPGRVIVDWMKIERQGGQTLIDGDMITTGQINADRLDVTSIFAEDVTATGTITGAKIVAGEFNAGGLVSDDFVDGSDGFKWDWSHNDYAERELRWNFQNTNKLNGGTSAGNGPGVYTDFGGSCGTNNDGFSASGASSGMWTKGISASIGAVNNWANNGSWLSRMWMGTVSAESHQNWEPLGSDEQGDITESFKEMIYMECIFSGELYRKSYSGGFQTGVTQTVDWVTASDERLKQEITDFSNNEALNIIASLTPKKFEFREGARPLNEKYDTPKQHYGLMAQDVEANFPFAYMESEKEKLTRQMNYYNSRIADLTNTRNYTPAEKAGLINGGEQFVDLDEFITYHFEANGEVTENHDYQNDKNVLVDKDTGQTEEILSYEIKKYNDRKLVPVLVQAIKDLKKRIEALESS